MKPRPETVYADTPALTVYFNPLLFDVCSKSITVFLPGKIILVAAGNLKVMGKGSVTEDRTASEVCEKSLNHWSLEAVVIIDVRRAALCDTDTRVETRQLLMTINSEGCLYTSLQADLLSILSLKMFK